MEGIKKREAERAETGIAGSLCAEHNISASNKCVLRSEALQLLLLLFARDGDVCIILTCPSILKSHHRYYYLEDFVKQ